MEKQRPTASQKKMDTNRYNGRRVLITGHTHIPAWRDHGSWYYANPGSLGQARGGAPESYMVYEDSCFRWYDADGQVWMEKRI